LPCTPQRKLSGLACATHATRRARALFARAQGLDSENGVVPCQGTGNYPPLSYGRARFSEAKKAPAEQCYSAGANAREVRARQQPTI